MKIVIDSENYVIAYATIGDLENSIETEYYEFEKPYYNYKYIKKQFVYDNKKEEANNLKEETKRNILNCKQYLEETDYIVIQWQDENSLGIPHNKTEEEYINILKKRQEARETIRKDYKL